MKNKLFLYISGIFRSFIPLIKASIYISGSLPLLQESA